MEETILLLMKFGLTRLEAVIYYNLLIREYMTGYEIAKETQISRSNVYSSLASLEKKGAIYLAAEENAKYIAVKIDDFCDNCVYSLKSAKDNLIKLIPKSKNKVENYITINGRHNIINKARNMISHAEQRVYISTHNKIFMLFYDEFKMLENRNLRIVIITDKEMDFHASEIYYENKDEYQLDLIIDSKEVMSGRISENCLYSMNDNLIVIFKKMLKNEIELIKHGGSKN